MEAIAPLEELARKWREESIPYTNFGGKMLASCADELSSLFPALASRIEALEAEIVALKEQHRLECDRQTSHWVEIVKEQGEQLRLERAAFAAKASEIDREEAEVLKAHGFDAEAAHFEMNAAEILALADSDRSALEAHDANVIHGIEVMAGVLLNGEKNQAYAVLAAANPTWVKAIEAHDVEVQDRASDLAFAVIKSKLGETSDLQNVVYEAIVALKSGDFR